ncbi:hypothetical protein ACWIUD_03860 [Helicobacter sp. 23-1044]
MGVFGEILRFLCESQNLVCVFWQILRFLCDSQNLVWIFRKDSAIFM